jgi:DUF971 family protein
MTGVPTDIRALRDERVLAVTWGDRTVDFPFVFLRGQCSCAQCVHEWTGEQLLDLSTIPEDIAIEKMDLVGSYAVRLNWSDGHNSGLFTWERLQELSQGTG